MFDAPVDAWYVWLGVTLASLAVFGVATELPTTPPPDAGSAADTVDSVAGCEYTATAEHPLSARKIKLGAHRLGLRGEGGTAHATFVHPVTPIRDDDRLRRVLAGTPPSSVFDSPADFRRATQAARNRRASWQGVQSTLRIRCLSWEGVDATLVG